MKKTIILNIFCLACLIVNGQQNSSIRQKINYKFAPLKNSTYLTTGYLYDKSVPDVDATKFNGIVNTTDTNSASQMRQLIWPQQNAYMPVNKDASVELLKVFL